MNKSYFDEKMGFAFSAEVLLLWDSAYKLNKYSFLQLFSLYLPLLIVGLSSPVLFRTRTQLENTLGMPMVSDAEFSGSLCVREI